jgi:hypothetical protein
MPRHFADIENGYDVRDEEGREVPDVLAAQCAAHIVEHFNVAKREVTRPGGSK